jgi:hypothetical protein
MRTAFDRLRRAMPIAVIMLPIVAAPVLAQAASKPAVMDPRIKRGADVRLWSAKMSWSNTPGKVDSTGRDTIVVAVPVREFGRARTQRYLMPVWEIDTLKVFVPGAGAGRLERRMTIGGVTVGAIAAVVGIVLLAQDGCQPAGAAIQEACPLSDVAIRAATWGIGGGLVGVAIGAVWDFFTSVATAGEWVTATVPRPAG